MSTMRKEGPQFHGAFMGYNKSEVDDYVSRMESELDICENSQEKLEKQIETLNGEIDRLNCRADTDREEKKILLEKQSQMTRTIEDLEKLIQAAAEEKERFRKEYEKLKESTEASDMNPKMIQDAILNAQRMGEIVISEANEKADQIIHGAVESRREQEAAGKQALDASREEAKRITEEAEQRCVCLQKEYDRILLDVTGFKSELMKMYRRHMELLAAMPEKQEQELDATYKLSDTEEQPETPDEENRND